MRRMPACIALMLAVSDPVMSVAQPIADQPASIIHGSWINPRRNLTIQAEKCGDLLCGWVVAATKVAQDEARNAGTDQLIGKNLLEDFKETSPNHWEGRVFVPKHGSTYFSRIEQVSANEIKITGCIFGGMICKAEIWRRG